ncbi:hypothetical protein PspR76_12165 [Pseudomonas sp. R76]|nr:hypothetical protein PspR76_12165 [Pseudomonas sp. R76]
MGATFFLLFWGWHNLAEETRSKCGSGLARECGGSVNTDVDCSTAFASKPAPTFDLCRPSIVVQNCSLSTPTCSGVQAQCSLLNSARTLFPSGSSPCRFGTKLALLNGQIHSNNKKGVSCH